MDIQKIMDHADWLFDNGKSEDAARYLEEQRLLAETEGDWGTELSVLNELMGYYRSKSIFDKSVRYRERAMEILKQAGIEQSVAAATTYLNAATLYRAMGDPARAMEIYQQAEAIYRDHGIMGNLLAGLYNNMCVASLDLEKPELAVWYGEKSVEAIQGEKDSEVAQGIIYSNLAGYFLKCQPERLQEAENYLNQSVELFRKYCPDDAHFCSVLAMQAYVLTRKDDIEGAIRVYRQALEHTLRHYGKNKDFQLILKNCITLYEKSGQSEEADKLRYKNQLDCAIVEG